jgi:VIT1/CCC1 family predicted Fe2+/Mn2+ transporter
MDVLGWVFIALLGLVLTAAVVMGVASLPDAKRYLKLRRM